MERQQWNLKDFLNTLIFSMERFKKTMMIHENQEFFGGGCWRRGLVISVLKGSVLKPRLGKQHPRMSSPARNRAGIKIQVSQVPAIVLSILSKAGKIVMGPNFKLELSYPTLPLV